MRTILNDLKAAAGLFVDMRKARKRGGAIRGEKKYRFRLSSREEKGGAA